MKKMKVNELEKVGYMAPKMEAASFRLEQGYANSVSTSTSSVKIAMTGNSL